MGRQFQVLSILQDADRSQTSEKAHICIVRECQGTQCEHGLHMQAIGVAAQHEQSSPFCANVKVKEIAELRTLELFSIPCNVWNFIKKMGQL